ncbi:MAG TPA: endo-1,4-beta-xylanase, partial [Ignavibacteriaceae bacterium]|nr:endo-1,4-beta-xylanase [Ignavibacteriaceae bacterium]
DYFLIGTALNNAQFSGRDTLSVDLVKKHFNTITPENVLKWGPVHPQKDKYNFEPADQFVEFGEKNNMFIIGHTLVWHAQTPRWVFEIDSTKAADRETLLNRMKEHIFTVVGRYKGKVKGWDVVNEALNENGTLRESQWMKIIGEDFIARAFQFAHEADPDAQLYYNDFSLENKSKREGAIKLIKNLQSQGIKIYGVGLQGHYKLDWPTPTQLDSTIKDFAALGIKVMITELDVDVLPYENITAEVNFRINMDKGLQEKFDPYKNGLPDSMQTSLAERYSDLFKVFVENKNSVDRVTFWGVSDKDSWLNFWPIRGRSNYPLLFDRNGKPKPAFFSVLKTTGIN